MFGNAIGKVTLCLAEFLPVSIFENPISDNGFGIGRIVIIANAYVIVDRVSVLAALYNKERSGFQAEGLAER